MNRARLTWTDYGKGGLRLPTGGDSKWDRRVGDGISRCNAMRHAWAGFARGSSVVGYVDSGCKPAAGMSGANQPAETCGNRRLQSEPDWHSNQWLACGKKSTALTKCAKEDITDELHQRTHRAGSRKQDRPDHDRVRVDRSRHRGGRVHRVPGPRRRYQYDHHQRDHDSEG